MDNPHTCPNALNYAAPLIRAAMQKMIPPPPDVEDAVLHFRCGDILKYAHHTEYGYPRYSFYRCIFRNPKSIAIVTAPWRGEGEGLYREKDAEFNDVCRAIVMDMVEYFQSAFPDAIVRIRNNESLPKRFGRLIHAKQSVCSPSTFCLYPAIAATGESYIIYSEKLYPFIKNINFSNLHVVEEEFLNMKDVVRFRKKGKDLVKAITSWMREPGKYKNFPTPIVAQTKDKASPTGLISRRTTVHEVDSLGLSELTSTDQYIHFRNVAFDAKGNRLTLFQPSKEVRQMISRIDFQLPAYERWTGKKTRLDMIPRPSIVIQEDRPMDPAVDCPNDMRKELAFFHVPWVTHNMWHLHNDNILPNIDNIRHTPGCNETTLYCDVNTTLYLFDGTKRDLRPVKAAPVLWAALFDSVRPLHIQDPVAKSDN